MPHLATRRALTFAALALVACTAGAAALYKWVDEKGVTHYTQEPPPPERKATKMDIRTDAPDTKPESPESWKEKELDMRRRRLDKERTDEKEEASEKRAEEHRHAQCMQAQDRLSVLQSGHPVYTTNEKGERVYMEDGDREAEINRWRGEAQAWCKP